MCTVIISVPESPEDPLRLLAVRDENPQRPYRRVGAWWDEMPEVVGVQDLLAGGAWLAANPAARNLSVMVNREGAPAVARPTSRGTLVMSSMAGRPVPESPTTMGFNLLEIRDAAAHVTTWNGTTVTRERLSPGVHMIAHGDLDDPTTPRIAAWLPAFSQARTSGDGWWDDWIDVLHHTTHLAPEDDRAIIRDNRPHGYPTQSLMLCLASVGPYGMELRDAVLPAPGRWSPQLDWDRHAASTVT